MPGGSGRTPDDSKSVRVKCVICNLLIRDSGVSCSKCDVQLHDKCLEAALIIFHGEKSNWCCKNCILAEDNESHNIEFNVALLKCENNHLTNEISVLKKLINEMENLNKLQSVRIHELEAIKTVSILSPSNIEKASSLPSYSTVLKKPVNKQNSSTLIIKSNSSTVTNNNVMKEIMCTVNPAAINSCINGTRKIRNGVVIHCNNEESLNKLKNSLNNKLGPDYQINEFKKRNPRMLIKNVNLSEDLETDEQIINNIFGLNCLEDFNKTDIKIVTKLKHYANFNVVIETPPLLRKMLLSKGYLFIGWKKCELSDYVRIIRCFNCSNFGHTKKDCKSKMVCPICSEEHLLEDCKSEVQKCGNCISYNNRFKDNINVHHSAKDPLCPIYLNHRDNLRASINYD